MHSAKMQLSIANPELLFIKTAPPNEALQFVKLVLLNVAALLSPKIDNTPPLLILLQELKLLQKRIIIIIIIN
jgi:hypothetical protein